MSQKDRKNLADAKTFAIIYTAITTIIILGIYVLGASWLSAIPIIGTVIGGIKIIAVSLTSIFHLAIAALINWYFSYHSTKRKGLGYGYYAQRKGIGPHRQHPLERNLGKRILLFMRDATVVFSIICIVTGLLGCFSFGIISVVSNTIMMLLQRLIYTPNRARRLR